MVEYNDEHSIEALDLSDLSCRSRLSALWQHAYQVEAELLNVDEFPPLRFSSEALAARPGTFFGLVHGERLLGAIEIGELEQCVTEISALVVDPGCFRRGIGRRLVSFALGNASGQVRVSTSTANTPAVALYLSLGFRQARTFESPEGIELCLLVHEPMRT